MGLKKVRRNWFDILNITFFVVFSLLVIYPFWDLILISFSHPLEATSLGLHVWIKEWRLDSYRFIISDDRVGYAYFSTIFRTFFGTLFTVIVTLCGAYPLSKKELPGRNLLTTYFLITMFFGGGLIPFYLIVRKIGLIDTRWSLILPQVVNVYYIIIMRNYLMTMDRALEESAFIDGAGYLTVLTRIVMPLAKPVIATVVLWTAVHHWNEWFHALIFIRSRRKVVLQLLLRQMLEVTYTESDSLETFSRLEGAEVVSSTVRAGITLITIGPIVLLYPFVQKHFIKGIMIGSLKG